MLSKPLVGLHLLCTARLWGRRRPPHKLQLLLATRQVGTTLGTSLLGLYALPGTLVPDCSVHTFTDLGGYQCRSLPKVIWSVHFCPKYNEGFDHLHVIFLLGMEGEKNKQYPETPPTTSTQGLLSAKEQCLKARSSRDLQSIPLLFHWSLMWLTASFSLGVPPVLSAGTRWTAYYALLPVPKKDQTAVLPHHRSFKGWCCLLTSQQLPHVLWAQGEGMSDVAAKERRVSVS